MAGKPTYKELAKQVKDLEKKLAEHRQKQKASDSEENFRSLVENAYLGIFIFQDDGVAYANQKVLDIMGYTQEEVKAFGTTVDTKELSATFHPDDQERFLKRNRDRLAGKSIDPVQEYRLKTRNAHYIWVETYATPLTFNGEPAWMVMYRDITERKKLEQSVIESESRCRGFLENLSDIAYELDGAGNISYANPMAAEIAGQPLREIVGKPFLPLFDGKSQELASRVYMETMKGKRHVFDLRFNNGVICQFNSNPLTNEKGDVVGVFGTARDITYLKETEQELKAARKKLEEQVAKRTEELGEANTALRILIQRQSDHSTDFERKVLYNIKELVQPYVEKLKKSRLNKSQKRWMEILETNLGDIVSPLVHGISLDYLKFTPTEIQIANFVKQGKTTTQIAEVMSLSEKTIGYHRDNIRKKIGIRNKKINLRTFLLSMK